MSPQNNCLRCEKCGNKYTNLSNKWCKPCNINDLKKKFPTWTSGNEKIDKLIQETQLNINSYNDIILEWIPFSQFSDIEEIGVGGFAKVYLAIWKDGPQNEYARKLLNERVALKCLHDSQDITNEFLHEVKAYSIINNNNILKIFGISQNPDTKEYIMVLNYAEGGNFNHWMTNNYSHLCWIYKIKVLRGIVNGLKEIHKKQLVHHDFHTGNILLNAINSFSKNDVLISDIGLCGKLDDADSNHIYGVMPYVAPEVLKGNPYTKAADIYSFGMTMYFIATGKQPFYDCAHDQSLALNICNGVRPEINESEVPACYIDLIKSCWDSNPDNRPDVIEIEELITLFYYSYKYDELEFKNKKNIKKESRHYEIEKQFKSAEEFREANYENNQQTTHPQAIYTSRLLNPYINSI